MRISQLVYLLAQVNLAVFNWLILTILAKSFGKSLVGEYSIILAWLTPIFLLYSLQIKSRYLTSTSEKLEEFISIRLVLIIPLILFSSLLLLLGYQSQIIIGVFILKLAELLFEIPFMKDQKKGDLLKASIIQLIKNIIVYSIILVLTKSLNDFNIAILLGGAVSLLSSICYFIFSKIKVSYSLNKAIVKSLLPLGIASFITSFTISIPRLYLKELIGIEAVALYTVIFSFYAIWQLLFNNYFNGILNYMHKMNTFKLIRIPLGAFFLAALIFKLTDIYLYEVLFGSSFVEASSYSYLLLINIFISFWTSLSYYQLLSKKDYSSQLKINIIVIISTIIITPIAVAQYQVYGALLSQGIIQSIQLFLYRRNLSND